MFVGTDAVLNSETVPSEISYNSFKTWNLPIYAKFYCDHRNFDTVRNVLLHV